MENTGQESNRKSQYLWRARNRKHSEKTRRKRTRSCPCCLWRWQSLPELHSCIHSGYLVCRSSSGWFIDTLPRFSAGGRKIPWRKLHELFQPLYHQRNRWLYLRSRKSSFLSMWFDYLKGQKRRNLCRCTKSFLERWLRVLFWILLFPQWRCRKRKHLFGPAMAGLWKSSVFQLHLWRPHPSASFPRLEWCRPEKDLPLGRISLKGRTCFFHSE